MRNFVKYLPVFLACILISNVQASDIRINFSSSSIEDARKKAGEEGKLIFVNFHAKWCTPCMWMEQTTFKDEKVANSLNENFISIKVDIDDLKGFELKKAYEIKYLPTMLIFNSQGQLVDRIEETLSPRLLSSVLEKHNAPENKLIIKHDFNVSPSQTAKNAALGETDGMKISREEYDKYYLQKQSAPAFTVQVGVFQKYNGANDMVNFLRQMFLEPVSVTNEYKDKMPIFKIRIGQFSTFEDADKFRKSLKADYNMEGIVI
jgi:thiol-disulfide isomerase/thioredoxin